MAAYIITDSVKWLARDELRMRLFWSKFRFVNFAPDTLFRWFRWTVYFNANKMSRKRITFNQEKKDTSEIGHTNDAQAAKEETKVQDEPHMLDSSKRVNMKKKSAKQAYIAFLPEKYQPLVEDDIVDLPRDDNIKKIQDKYKS